jgi:hypothetical protein
MASDADEAADEARAAEFARDVKALEKNPEGYSEDLCKVMLGIRIVRFAGTRVLQEAVAYMGEVDPVGK